MGTVIMPKMGDAMEEGTLLKWLKAAGDEVAEGDPIAEIETDKVTLEIEAQESGFITNLLLEEGIAAPIGTVIATIGAEGEVGVGASEATPAPEAAAPAEEAAAPSREPEPPLAAATPAPSVAVAEPPAQFVDRAPGERLRASPLVKRLAAEHNIDLNQVPGTGPGGRIINKDIQPYVSGEKQASVLAAQPEAAPSPAASTPAPAAETSSKGTLVDLARIRRVTGKRMTESKLGIPHYYVTSSVDMTAALSSGRRSMRLSKPAVPRSQSTI
jgi:pyruvate dehydrogenase E2 component (dihydrolipoamide acetyltransferase)